MAKWKFLNNPYMRTAKVWLPAIEDYLGIVTRICEKVSRAIKKKLPDDYLGITTRARRLVVSRAIKKAYTLTEISKIRNHSLNEQSSRLLVIKIVFVGLYARVRTLIKKTSGSSVSRGWFEFFESIRAGDIDPKQ